MNKRKKTPPATEADVLEKFRRRCCICYALNRDFKEKKGQIAHQYHNPSNYCFDNLCYLCQPHHDDYDAKSRQTKGLTRIEVKRYREDLYKTVSEWVESTQVVNGLSVGPQTPILKYSEQTIPTFKTTNQGLQITTSQPGIRLSDKKYHPTVNLDIHFKEMVIGSRRVRLLCLTTSLNLGLNIRSEVCACDNWNVTGFMNVLRNNLDIWMLRGQNIRYDDRDPMMQPRDSLLVYHTNDGENFLVISTHALSGATVQINMRCSNEVVETMADYLDDVGFSKPFDE